MSKQTSPSSFLLSILLLLLLPLGSLSNVTFRANDRSISDLAKIDGNIDISLKKERLFASLKYDYVATETAESIVSFYLSQEFQVNTVKCGICQSFDIDRQTKPAPSLVINLKKPLQQGKHLLIEIDYHGSLKKMYKADQDFLELGLDDFWFPIQKDIGRFNFTFHTIVKADEPNLQLFSNGRVARKGGGWLVESRMPDFDIDLVLGKNLNVNDYRQNGYNLQVVSKNLPDDVPATLLNNMKEVLGFYNSSYGAIGPQHEVTAVIRPFPEVGGQGGYFRKGYFIIYKMSDIQGYFFYVAHELAHYWWLKADQQNAWLNESFAEYSAMMALRKLRGPDEFNKLVEQKTRVAANLPAIYGFDRTKNRKQTPQVLYSKGPLKLRDLENELGEQRFMAFLTAVLAANVKDTDALLKVLAQQSSKEIADDFLQRLKE